MELTETEVAVLDLERGRFRHAGRKAAVIRERFGWTETVYFARLNALIDRPEAMAYDAVLVRRLVRLREARRRARCSRVAPNG